MIRSPDVDFWLEMKTLLRTIAETAMGMLKPLLVTLCLLLPLTSSKSIDVHYCDKKSDYSVKVSGVEISPFPVPRAKPTTFAISSCTDRAIAGGNIKIEVSYFGFHVHSESHGLCNDIVCPIPVGDFVLSHSVILPGITPPGSYTFRMRIEDENKRQLTCVTFDFTIGFLAPEALSEI